MSNSSLNQSPSRDFSGNKSSQHVGASENVINLKLPALNLPTSSGFHEKWPGFSDTFKSAVHNDKRYTDSQRLIILRSCLTVKAADRIESLETTNANYQVAWEILEKYDDDPTAVINNHVTSIFESPNCRNSSATSIGDLLNNVTKHYRALEALNKSFLQAFPIYAVTSRVDPQTRLKWKEHTQGNTSPTMEELLEFLHCREKVLETNKLPTKIDRSERNVSRGNSPNLNYNNRQSHFQSNSNRPAVTYAAMKAFCYICKGAHFTQGCEKLVNDNLSERLDIVKNLNLCLNCLRSNHSVENCNASMCKTFKKRHHTLLHRDDNTKLSTQVNLASLHSATPSQVLLLTAIIHILDHEGNPHKCRALLDNGSQVYFITEKLATKLGLRQRELGIPLRGVNHMRSSVNKITNTTVQPRLNK